MILHSSPVHPADSADKHLSQSRTYSLQLYYMMPRRLSFLHRLLSTQHIKATATVLTMQPVERCPLCNRTLAMSRAHSFPQQILPNSAAPFAKLRGSPRQIQILGIPRLTAAAHFRVHCKKILEVNRKISTNRKISPIRD